jgi:hypothetical protein
MIRKCHKCFQVLTIEQAWHKEEHVCSDLPTGAGYFEQKELLMEGRKFDSEKPKMYLLPPKSMVEISKVLTFGAQKYDEDNWRKLDNLQNRYSGGALRHIFAHLDGELKDEETNYSHLAHAICCLLFKLEIELEKDCKEERLREPDEQEHREGDSTFKPGYFSPSFGGIQNQKSDN